MLKVIIDPKGLKVKIVELASMIDVYQVGSSLN